MIAYKIIEVEIPSQSGCARKLAKQPLIYSRLDRVRFRRRDFRNLEAELPGDGDFLPLRGSGDAISEILRRRSRPSGAVARRAGSGDAISEILRRKDIQHRAGVDLMVQATRFQKS